MNIAVNVPQSRSAIFLQMLELFVKDNMIDDYKVVHTQAGVDSSVQKTTNTQDTMTHDTDICFHKRKKKLENIRQDVMDGRIEILSQKQTDDTIDKFFATLPYEYHRQ